MKTEDKKLIILITKRNYFNHEPCNASEVPFILLGANL